MSEPPEAPAPPPPPHDPRFNWESEALAGGGACFTGWPVLFLVAGVVAAVANLDRAWPVLLFTVSMLALAWFGRRRRHRAAYLLGNVGAALGLLACFAAAAK